jgi:predicted glutamine amidotransferase
MCRLLAIVSSKPRSFGRCLREAPRSLAALGREHADGWGIAVHQPAGGWSIAKRAGGADGDPEYEAAAAQARGSLLLAHVRRRTVGGLSLQNTHPFRHGDWVFAHNGTIDRLGELRDAIGDGGVTRIVGETDSEVLFAFLLSRLGSLPGGLQARSRFITEMVLARAVEDLASIDGLGTATFILSDAGALYAYRHGRPLFLLERRVEDQTDAILVASEPVTDDEPWTPVGEGTLIAIWRTPRLGWAVMAPRPRIKEERTDVQYRS